MYYKLWNVLDPPKPDDDNALTKHEVEAINECDQIFDQWNEKYAGAADFVKKVVMFGSHKFFYLPFTHFYGYLHFTVRVQETWKKWQWDSHDIARFRKNRGIDIRQLQKRDEGTGDFTFKYRGKLVPELKTDILKQLTAAQLDTSNKRGGRGKGGPSESAEDAAAGQEGGDVEYSGGEAEDQNSSFKFWQSDKTFNPFDFVQSASASGDPRRDTRVKDLFNRQVSIDFAVTRVPLLVGNAFMLFVAFDFSQPLI